MSEESEARETLIRCGYNFALSDVEHACKTLDHPELTEELEHYHLWAAPYPRRCYCGAIAYTDKGRFYALHLSDAVAKIHRSIFGDRYPDGREIRDRFGEPYVGKEKSQ